LSSKIPEDKIFELRMHIVTKWFRYYPKFKDNVSLKEWSSTETFEVIFMDFFGILELLKNILKLRLLLLLGLFKLPI
jgi:hypothetical protein